MATGHSGFDQRLLEAARKCDEKVLQDLVRAGKANLNAKDKSGCTAVHLCCKAADLSSLALLLGHGARADLLDNSGMAPIHHAAMKNYIETMAVLISYGASVNIQNHKTKQTPLHLAGKERNQRSIKFLLFCGADINLKDKQGTVADLGYREQDIENCNAITSAFVTGHIQIFGKMIGRQEKHVFSPGRITISNTSTKSRQFSFLCRKVDVAYVDVDLIESEGLKATLNGTHVELISDIYEYLVNQGVDEVWVKVPINTKGTKFDNIFVVDSTGKRFESIEVTENDETLYCTVCMILRAYEDTIYSFAVVMETKSDVYIFDGKAQTLTSTVEDEFQIQLPENCLPKNTQVAMRVIPTAVYQKDLNQEFIEQTSHFCEIRINQKNRKPLNITLPVPNGHTGRYTSGDDTRLTVFHSNEAHEGAEQTSDWKEVDCAWSPGSNVVSLTDKSINNGTCIVAEVRKKTGLDILGKIKQFMHWLYNTAVRRNSYVCFFALTKHSSKNIFRLLVGVSDAERVSTDVEKWETDKYVGDLSQRTSIYLVASGTKFAAKLMDSKDKKDPDTIEFIFHRYKSSHADFIVTGNVHDFCKVEIFKVQKENNKNDQIKTLENSLTKINVELLVERNKTDDTSSLQFTEYPDDRFLSWLAEEIGHEWIRIGIYLGFNFSFLERIERDNTPVRANLTMLYAWRNEQNGKEDLGIKSLLHSLTSVERKDLVTQINQDIQKLLSTSPDERVCRWVKRLNGSVLKKLDKDSEEGREYDIDGPISQECDQTHDDNMCISCLLEPAQAASPLSEMFLVQLAGQIGSNFQLILQLGQSSSSVEEIRRNFRDHTTAMFKCLLLAKRRYSDPIKFFESLLEGLKIQRDMHTLQIVQGLCTDWFKSNRSSMNRQMKRLQQLINRH